MERRFSSKPLFKAGCLCVLAVFSHYACAQHADENVITSAEDAFGTSVSGEAIGLYDAYGVRGFSPSAAGNLRVEGLYFDQQAELTIRAQAGNSVHVGASAQGYIFPAPTGIVDYSLRRSDNDNSISPVATYDSNGTQRFEVDTKISLLDSRLTSAVGASIGNNHFGYGGQDHRVAFGLVPRWRITKNIEITAFWGRAHFTDEEGAPIYLPDAALEVPPTVKRNWYPGPSWATNIRTNDNQGILGLATIGDWTLRAGAFHSQRDIKRGFANLYFDVAADGTGEHLIFADPPQRAASTSGEVRLSRTIGRGKIKQLLLASLRWRNVASLYGGSDYYDAGVVNVNAPLDVAKPVFNFGEYSMQHVTQQTVGINYRLHWDKVGDLGIGIQHVDYSKHDVQPGLPTTRISASPWLQNMTLSLNVAASLVAYASYGRGLEDNGNAPDSAVNRGQPLPAIKSRQYDAGLRWSPNDNTSVIVGYFDISKPYVTADNTNVYRLLGQEVHRGIEVSVTRISEQGLTVVFGGVFMQPRINNVKDAGEVIGRLPVGTTRNNLQLNLNYVLPFAKRLSINAGLAKWSAVATTVDNHAYASFPLILSAGGRYKFKLGTVPVTARIYVNNVTNSYYWYFAGSNAFQPSNQATTTVSIAADF